MTQQYVFDRSLKAWKDRLGIISFIHDLSGESTNQKSATDKVWFVER